ncbi:hypothetical protein VKT23_008829 [Stygiomarasmius scandens]|uniref:DUF6532 domain-containing protein n=1 Tax=Marasmiellus scandens TaxID=2682957 RepID=A0ABR1JKZ5_9AGAR
MKKTLKRFFFQTSGHIGSQLLSTFSCAWEDPTGKDKRNEIPVRFVALAATAIFASLTEWQKGTHNAAHFTADTFSSVYNAHVIELQNMVTDHPASAHRILAELLEFCINRSITKQGGGALRLADLD